MAPTQAGAVILKLHNRAVIITEEDLEKAVSIGNHAFRVKFRKPGERSIEICAYCGLARRANQWVSHSSRIMCSNEHLTADQRANRIHTTYGPGAYLQMIVQIKGKRRPQLTSKRSAPVGIG